MVPMPLALSVMLIEAAIILLMLSDKFYKLKTTLDPNPALFVYYFFRTLSWLSGIGCLVAFGIYTLETIHKH